MKKSEKAEVITSLEDQLKNAKSATIVDYQGLATKDLETLRSSLRDVGGSFSIVKNTLLKIAFKNTHGAKGENETVDSGLEGPTALILATDDEIAPLQTLAKFSKESGLPKLKFGFFSGDFVATDTLTVLSKLPAKQTLYAQLVGSLAGPSYALVGTLNATLQQLVNVLDQRSKQLGSNS